MKRFFDFIVSAAAVVGLSPVLLILATVVRWTLGAPVLFRQQRPGLRGRPFMLLKFRTMTNARGHDGALLPDAARLTRFGRFLRATSLDELPELLNVLKGDMSLVGPRPLLMKYLERYSPKQARRHEVRPGITGWAQVNGRNAITWEEKFKLDVWYVDNQSFWLDIKIVFLTILKIFKREGINQAGQATMEEFMGTDGDAKRKLKPICRD
ncbi:MAG: sugar transferase [Candidatus Vecturithrix sp.]|nr:sugar transferase [Candidatus Vecturithrix sp.]